MLIKIAAASAGEPHNHSSLSLKGGLHTVGPPSTLLSPEGSNRSRLRIPHAPVFTRSDYSFSLSHRERMAETLCAHCALEP